jgi:hypothetical protein
MANQSSVPDYKRIFKDILALKYPHKMKNCTILLSKECLSITDILQLNKIIFGKETFTRNNMKFRSYDRSTILEILNYQKHHQLNNTQLAKYYGLSRNTVSKWKRIFL